MITTEAIRTAIEFEQPSHPILSIYLNVDPAVRTVEQFKLALRKLLSEVSQSADSEDAKRIQNYVEMGYNRSGRGLVMFSCAQADFWWVAPLAVPVEDQAFVSFRPYVRQLATLFDTYDRYGVIHIDQEGARLYLFNLGVLEAAAGFLGEEIKVHRAGGLSSPRLQRREEEQVRQNLQGAAEAAEDFYRRAGTRHLILAGSDKSIARFKELLSYRLRSMVAGQINASANASPAEIRDRALGEVQKTAHNEAIATADTLVTRASTGGNAVTGLADTLEAVQNGRAHHLLVINSFARPAYRFVESGHIVLELSEQADLASGRIQNLPDAVESAIRRAMLQGIDVTILDQHAGLEAVGKIGALTRY